MLRNFQLPVTVHHWWRKHIQDHLCKLQIDWYCFSNIPNGEALTTLKLTLLSRPYHSNTNSNSWNSLFHVLSWDIEKVQGCGLKTSFKGNATSLPIYGNPKPKTLKMEREHLGWEKNPKFIGLEHTEAQYSQEYSPIFQSACSIRYHTSHGRFCGYHCCLTSHLRTRVEPQPYPGISSTMYYW